MTKAQALKLARAKWGESAHLRYNRGAIGVTTRHEVAAHAARLREERPAQIDSPEYRAWKKELDGLVILATTVPYSIGYLSAIAFHIRGSGDSWEEACEKAGLK